MPVIVFTSFYYLCTGRSLLAQTTPTLSCTGGSSGVSALLKDTSARRLEEPGIELPPHPFTH